MDYLLHILIIICIYTMLSQSLSLVAGYSGQISLAHAGFYGIGAYTTAILSTKFGLPVLFTTPIALLIAGIVAFAVAKVALKTVDDYYIIITLGIQVIVFSVMNNWQGVTRGPLGIPAIPAISLFGMELDSKWSFLIFSMILCAITWVLINNIIKSPFGRVLCALSEDEIFTKSLGKDVEKFKVISFVFSGAFAAISGILYAHYISYVNPSNFTIEESIFILSVVIIGGMRNLTGIMLASVFLILLPESLRFIGIPNSVAANSRQIIYGLTLIIVMLKPNQLKARTKAMS